MRPTVSDPRPDRAPAGRRQRGFTLVEMIIAIVLIGTLAMVAVPLLRLPLTAWMDVSRRAQLVADVDLVHSKLAEDLRLALPGSVRRTVVGSRVLLEFMEVRAQGHYRAAASAGAQVCPATCLGAGQNDRLQAGCTETCFTSLSPLVGAAPVAGDWVVVDPTGGNPYLGGNVAVAAGIKTRLTSVSAAPAPNVLRVDIAAKNFPSLPASQRFYVVATPVTYDCNPATGRLTRYWGYPVSAAQPVGFGGTTPRALLATTVTLCNIAPPQPLALPASGRQLVNVHLRLSRLVSDIQLDESADLVASLAVGEDL
jgi:MSHA biogenesis protein MshO